MDKPNIQPRALPAEASPHHDVTTPMPLTASKHKSVPRKNLIDSFLNFTARMVVFVATVYLAWKYWNTPPVQVCKANDEECLGDHTSEQISSILHATTRLVIVMLILGQIVYYFDINMTPIVATLGVFVAALGFTLSDPLHDYVMGICLTLMKKIAIHMKVNVLLYGQAKSKGPIFVTNLSPLTIDGFDEAGQMVSIRYSYIQMIERISQEATQNLSVLKKGD